MSYLLALLILTRFMIVLIIYDSSKIEGNIASNSAFKRMFVKFIISQIYHKWYDKYITTIYEISILLSLSLFHSRHADNLRAPRATLAVNKERMDNAWPFAHTGCTLLASKAPLLPLKAPFEAICQMISRLRYSSVCYTCCILTVTVMQRLGELAYLSLLLWWQDDHLYHRFTNHE